MVSTTKTSQLGRRSAEILARLRRDIDRGIFAPGDRLPTEKELCGTLKVGRTALRRAMSHLAADGVVDIRQGSGTYVCKALRATPGSGVVSLMYRFDERMFTEIQEYLLDRQLLLCVYSQDRTHWDPKSERRFLRRVKEEGHRALLAFCSPLEPSNDSSLAALEMAGTRVIHIEPYRTRLPDQEYIMPDYRKAGHMAVIELLLAGYSRIILAGTSFCSPFAALFAEGVAAGLTEHGGGYDAESCRFDIGLAFKDNAESQERLLDRIGEGRSTGIACTSAQMADLLGMWLSECGVSVPEEVGLVGPTLIGPHHAEQQTACIYFDRVALLKRAVDAAMKPWDQKARILVAPEFRSGNTMRKR